MRLLTLAPCPTLSCRICEGRRCKNDSTHTARWVSLKFCESQCKLLRDYRPHTAQGLVHRDIKPGNILLEDGVERLKITDFGLARAADDASLTRTGVIAGTPQFMSPEQARGEPIDSRSDLFSLGSVMYAMCTGFPPFRAETSYGTLSRICDSQPHPIREINPEIPQWLVAVIEQLHEKNPTERFQTAQQVAHLLEQCLAHLRQPDVAPLPKAVVELLARKTSATPSRRAVWHSRLTPRQLRARPPRLCLPAGGLFPALKPLD